MAETFTARFVGALEGVLAPHGFWFDRDANLRSFLRTQGHFQHEFSLADDENAERLSVGPGVSISVEPIEWFYHRTSYYADTRYGATAPASIGRLMGKLSDPYWNVTSERSLGRAVKQITKMFEKYALPFYATYSNLEALDREINGQPESFEYWMGGGHPAERSSRGVILAKLLGRPDFDNLCAIYDRQIHKLSPNLWWPHLKALISDLRENGDLLVEMWNSPPQVLAERGRDAQHERYGVTVGPSLD